MSKRYFVETPIKLGEIVLDGPEAHHLVSVMRAKPGDEIILFDGTGFEFIGNVIELTRKQVRVEVVKGNEINRELSVSIEIGAALPKGDRQRVLIEKLVEVGVGKFVPLRTVRSIVQPEKNTIARLERMVIEASKQCQRNTLMKIGSPQNCGEYFKDADGSSLRLIAVPNVDGVKQGSIPADKPCICAIGPEGGFTDDECRMASESDWQVVNLGKRVLRTETAAIAMASYFAAIQ